MINALYSFAITSAVLGNSVETFLRFLSSIHPVIGLVHNFVIYWLRHNRPLSSSLLILAFHLYSLRSNFFGSLLVLPYFDLLTVHPSVRPSIHIFLCRPTYLHPSIHPSTHQWTHPSPLVCFSVHQFFNPTVCPSTFHSFKHSFAHSLSHSFMLSTWLTDWLVGWLTDWSIDQSIGLSINSLINNFQLPISTFVSFIQPTAHPHPPTPRHS